MRRSLEKSQRSKRLAVLVTLMCALVSIPALSSAASNRVSSALPMMTIAVTNNSGRDIYHVYLSPTDREAWGPDLLNETIIQTGQTFTLSDISCGANDIKIIAEDKEGCFSYGVMSCAQASTGWTLTSETPRDCGN